MTALRILALLMGPMVPHLAEEVWSMLGGEGLVCELTGPGRVLMQTRSEEAFLGWLIPKLPKSSNN